MDYAEFAALLSAHNTTAYRVAKDTGIAPSTLADWKSGRSTPKADKLARIADYFGVSLDTMLGRNANRPIVPIPIIGEIRAGQPIITEQTLQGYESAIISDAEADDYFYLRIRGDSMRDVGMVEGRARSLPQATIRRRRGDCCPLWSAATAPPSSASTVRASASNFSPKTRPTPPLS